MEELPLFPLHSVLFPGGELRLRVFEPRYLGLVRDCTRDGRPFGVCHILAGSEVGAPATPASFGCTARIVDFHVGDDGLLGITALGEQRFHVQRLRVRDNGLLVAAVEACDDEAQVLRPEHALLASILERILEQVGGRHSLAAHCLYDDAHWVGYRLAELLPLGNDERQALLQLACPHRRLQTLLQRLPQLAA